jgi:phosphopantothenoylcysteine decarboxylase / phosphopantothenate---cysteine ligase
VMVAVRSAEDMKAAVRQRVSEVSVVAMAAAVSDFKPATVADRKVKKTEGGATLELVRTADILQGLGRDKGALFLVGFAAETDRVAEYARKKRAEKNLDLMVANDVSKKDGGFASSHNSAILIDAAGEQEVPLTTKRMLADRIWDRVAELRRGSQVK